MKTGVTLEEEARGLKKERASPRGLMCHQQSNTMSRLAISFTRILFVVGAFALPAQTGEWPGVDGDEFNDELSEQAESTELASPQKEQLAIGAKIHTVEIMSIQEIKKMSIKDRLTTMEQIWDSLCHEDFEPESPSWHETVLGERKKMMASPEARFLTIEQLRERYR